MDDLRDGPELHDLDAQSLSGHHVFAWITGFGRTIVPFAPYRFERGGDRSLRVEHLLASGPKVAVITVSADGRSYDVALEPNTSHLSEVAEVLDGPDWAEWRITSDALLCDWPCGFAFASLPGMKPPVFEWVGPDESRIWIQGPLPVGRLPRPERMGSPDQRVERVTALTNGPLVELTYLHEGQPWRMLHAVHSAGAPLERPRGVLRWLKLRTAGPAYALIVSAQAPEQHAGLVRAAVIQIAGTLTPNEDHSSA